MGEEVKMWGEEVSYLLSSDLSSGHVCKQLIREGESTPWFLPIVRCPSVNGSWRVLEINS